MTPATGKTAYVNARLLDPAGETDAAGGLITDGAVISAVGPEITASSLGTGIDRIVDCQGHVLAPGLIDSRVFVGEPGEEHKETLASVSQAAAAGGVTTVLAMPNTDPVIDDVALLGYIIRLAEAHADVHIRPLAALTKAAAGKEMAELRLLHDAGAVAFSDGRQGIADPLVMRRSLSYAACHDLLICQYPEEARLCAEGVMNEGETAMRLGLTGKPSIAETIAVERDIRLVELTGGRCHFTTLSTAGAIDAVRRAKAAGIAVSAAAAVHNFALNDTEIGDYRTFCKTDPPLRHEDDRAAVVAGLQDGTIDIICSAHDPQDPESKRLPFELAASGIVGVETMLPLALELYHNGALSLMQVFAAMTIRPAERFGLSAGRLQPGAPADLVLCNINRPWRIDEDNFHSKSKNSPFDGRPVQGCAVRTIVHGGPVFERA